jgi:hypothetical protein
MGERIGRMVCPMLCLTIDPATDLTPGLMTG